MNLMVRAKNQAFWLTLIPTLLVLIQVAAALFGYEFDISLIQVKILALVDAVFAVLAVLGVANDPTTAGFTDSAQALTYEEPKPTSEPKHARSE